MMHGLLVLGVVTVALQGQGSTIAEQAQVARRAWERHDVRLLIHGSSGVQVNLPGAEPSVALAGAQAIATLRTFLNRSEELRVVVTAAREVGGGRAYVELGREYQVRGTGEARSQRVLLGYRRERGGWVLTEVRVLE